MPPDDARAEASAATPGIVAAVVHAHGMPQAVRVRVQPGPSQALERRSVNRIRVIGLDR